MIDVTLTMTNEQLEAIAARVAALMGATAPTSHAPDRRVTTTAVMARRPGSAAPRVPVTG